MELKLQEVFSEALSEENEFKRLKFLSKGCKTLSEQLPFPSLLVIFQKQPDLMKFLFISSPLFGNTIEMIISAITEKLSTQNDFIEKFYQSASQVSALQDSNNNQNFQGFKFCRDVYKNSFAIKKELLIYCRKFADQIMFVHGKNQNIGQQVINFYKTFLTQNTRYDLLNICFKDAMEVRKQWKEMTFYDPYFEREIEEILIRKNIDSKAAQAQNDDQEKQILLDLLKQKNKQNADTMNEQEKTQNKINKQERIIRSLEEWLYHPNEFPIISQQQSSTTFHCDLFRNIQYFETLLSFLFNPLKNKLIAEYNQKQQEIQNFIVEDIYIPYFRREWMKEDQIYYIPQGERAQMSYRALRVMQALTNIKNHFLITQANPEYFLQTCFHFIMYENFKISSSGFVISVNQIFHYLQFLLYYEPDITIYFILHYNLPFRFMLYLEIPIVSQFFIQLSLNGSVYYRIPTEQLNMIWTYYELTNFFQELIKISLMPLNNSSLETITHYKALVSYKPKNISDHLIKPDLTPLQNQKVFVGIEQRKLVEELDKHLKDIDLVQPLIKKRQLRAVKLFEKMIQNSPRRKKSIRQEQMKPIEILPKSKFKKIPKENIRNSDFKRKRFGKLMTSCFNYNLDKEPSTILEHQNSASIIDENDKSSPKSPSPKSPKREINPQRKTIFRIIETAILNHNSSNKETVAQKKPSDHQKNLKAFRIKQNQRLSSLQISPIVSVTLTPVSEVNKRSFQQKNILSPKESVLLNIQNVQSSRNDQTSLIKRFQYLIQEKRISQTAQNSRNYSGLELVDQSLLREQFLYPSNMRDFHQTNIELEGKKPDYEYEWLEQNERFSREVIQMVFDIMQFHINDRKKFNIIIGSNITDHLKMLAKNYFLKLKIPEEDMTCALISGRIYNQVIKLSADQLATIDSLVYEQFQFLCQLITSTFLLENQRKEPLLIQQNQIFYQIRNKTLILIESLTLMIENTQNKQKYLLCISTSLWHLLLIYLTEYRTNELYQQLFQRIIKLAILYGNIQILNRIILRLNIFNHIKLILEEIYSNNILDTELCVDFLFQSIKQLTLLMYVILKVKSQEFSQLKQQLDIMASWDYIKHAFRSSLNCVERGDFEEFQKYVKNEDERKIFSKLIESFQQKKKQKKN